jgi:hypothetical protein
VALVRNDVSEERIISIIRVEGIRDVGFWLIPFSLMMEVRRSSETSVLTRATRRHISEDGILYSHRRESLKSYIALTGELCNGDVMCLL